MRLWPFRPAVALLSSVFLLTSLILVLIALREADALQGDGLGTSHLLGAVLLALVPVYLLVLDRVAAGGRIKGPGGLEISFDAVQQAARVDTGKHTISGNLGGTAGAPIADTTRSTILQALRPVLGTEVAVVDLGEGHEWWQTRLLLLLAGATRLGQPRVLVFTATVSGRSGQFIGWGLPRELQRAHLRNTGPRLQAAFRRAEAEATRWTLGVPKQDGGGTVTLPWSRPGTADQDEMTLPGPSATDLVPEQFLLQELAQCESPRNAAMPDNGLTVPLLHSLFTAVLREGSLERDADDARWRDAILGSTDDYIALTERGAYVWMVSRRAAVNAVLRSLVPSDGARPSGRSTYK